MNKSQKKHLTIEEINAHNISVVEYLVTSLYLAQDEKVFTKQDILLKLLKANDWKHLILDLPTEDLATLFDVDTSKMTYDIERVLGKRRFKYNWITHKPTKARGGFLNNPYAVECLRDYADDIGEFGYVRTNLENI